MSNKQAIGKKGELLACEYFERNGYVILERNVRTPYGEIDLIISQPDRTTLPYGVTTIFVEVKTRTSYSFGFPEISISPRKKSHLLASIQHYLQEHAEIDTDWQVDVLAINLGSIPEELEIMHFPNAISMETEGL